MMRKCAVAAGVVLLVMLMLTACGGQSEASRAASMTKHVMDQHNTKYTDIKCVEPTEGHFVCDAAGSNTTSSLEAWCAVSADDDGTMVALEPNRDCHWPAITKSHPGRTDLVGGLP